MRLAFLVPAPDYPEPWRWAFDPEAAPLQSRGATVDPVVWTEPRDLSDYDLVMPLVAWGYHLRYAEWLSFLDRIEHQGVPLANPASLLRWNSDKAYLAGLCEKGVPTVPTIEASGLHVEDLASAAERFGTSELVVKPPVSASATGTHRIRVGDEIPASERGRRMMIQPFLPTIADGEYSLILFDGVPSHTLIKRPKLGDFRTQEHLGGTVQACDTPRGAVELAQAALAAAPAPATYARVDMIRDPAGDLRIMELELIEPSLWLNVAPHGEESFARAVFGAVKRLAEEPLP